MEFNEIFLKINEYIKMLQDEGLADEAIRIKEILNKGDSELQILFEINNLIKGLQYQKISKEIKQITSELLDEISEKLKPQNVDLTFTDLILKKEKKYYFFLLIFSILVWCTLAVSIIAIPIMLIVFFFVWLVNGLLVAYLKAEAVEVNENQMPELYKNFLDACNRLGLKNIPSIYILQSGGFLNAFATRHSSRDFVVLYGDIVEAWGSNSKELLFIIGHELGHIQRKHITKQILIMPGLLCPILAPAYSRACESSCDRYGVFVSKSLDASINAMLTLAGGKTLYKELNPKVFAQQHYNHRGFFVSLHEILSGYPTLSKRVDDLIQITTKKKDRMVKRHSLAYCFALFSVSSVRSFPFVVGLIFCLMFAVQLIPHFDQLKAASAETISQQSLSDNNGGTEKSSLEYFELGLSEFKIHKFDDAEKNFKLALEKFDSSDSDLFQIYYLLALTCEGKEDYEQAYENWQNALNKMEVKDPDYHAVSARIAFFENDLKACKTSLDECLRIDPKNEMALSMVKVFDKP